MTTAARTITKTAANGTAIVWTVEVTRDLRERVVNADGDIIHTGKMELVEYTRITVTAAGKAMGSGSCIEQPTPEGRKVGAVGRVGQVHCGADTRAEIETAIAEATAEVTTPEINAHIEATKDAEFDATKVEADYQAYTRSIDNAMTLGGKTF